MADLIRKLSADGAKIIAVDILLSEPEVSGELRAATQLSERLRTLGLAGSSAGSAVQRELDAFGREADHDRQLAEAVRDSGRVILPLVFEVGPDRTGPPPEPAQPGGAPGPDVPRDGQRAEPDGFARCSIRNFAISHRNGSSIGLPFFGGQIDQGFARRGGNLATMSHIPSCPCRACKTY